MKVPYKKLIYQEFDKEGNIVDQIEKSDFSDRWTGLKEYWTQFYFFFTSTIPNSDSFVRQYMFYPGDEHVHMMLDTSSSADDSIAEKGLERCLNKLGKEKAKKLLKKNGF